MGWERVMADSDLGEGVAQIVQAGGRSVLLARTGGRVYATDDHCPHVRLSLKRAQITDDACLVCPWHRSRFDLATGEAREWVTWPPGVRRALGPISRGTPLAVFPTKVEDGEVWVDVAAEGS